VSPALPELVVFDRNDPGPVITRMVALAADRSGWLVIDPQVEADDLARAPRTGGIFSGRGPAVPELSWVPGRPGRRGTPPGLICTWDMSPRMKSKAKRRWTSAYRWQT